jgi:hypothetical protein
VFIGYSPSKRVIGVGAPRSTDFFMNNMDVTFRENEPYHGSNVGSGISLFPLDE